MIGYWRDDKSTNECIRILDGHRYYVTGDICKRDARGRYHFIGRADDEVKVLGRRIHLNEVRNALLAHDGVSGAAVGILDGGDRKDIVAYITVRDAATFDISGYDAVIRTRLPVYMVPIVTVLSDQHMATNTGKADERALLARARAIATRPARSKFVWDQ